MIKMEDAIERARGFLVRNGLLFAILDEVQLDEQRRVWLVSFRFFWDVYTVDIDENGEIKGFKKVLAPR